MVWRVKTDTPINLPMWSALLCCRASNEQSRRRFVRYHTDAGLCSSLVYAQGCGPELKIVNRTPFEVDHVFPKMAGTQTHDLDALGPTAIISPAHDDSLDFGQASAQHYDVRFTLNAKTRRPINVTFQNDGLCHFHYLDPIFDKAGLNLAVHD